MKTVELFGRTYHLDEDGFLTDATEWTEDFAEGMAPDLGIDGGLTEEHWKVINFIRDTYQATGKCPLVYHTARINALHVSAMKALFPTGYLRGACKLAGLTYREGYLNQVAPGDYVGKMPSGPAGRIAVRESKAGVPGKVYRTDVRGFLVDPLEWDEAFAEFRAQDMKFPRRLTDEHWRIIKFLRERYDSSGQVPTVYETCEGNGIELDELEQLFPDGYHRGAVKIAGLRVR